MTSAPEFIAGRHNARSLALQVLLDCGRHERFVQEILDWHLSQPAARGLIPADRRLATHLSYGVLRRRGTLRALLASLINRSLDDVEPWLLDALCLGAYQLALLTQIPAHAALNETVELAGQFGRLRAKGFINGVLRACAGLMTNDRADGPAGNALPIEGGQYRRLTRSVLPSPDRQPVEYVASAFGLPRWLASRWLDRCGFHETIRLGFWFSGPAPLTLRVNALKITRDQLLASLTASGHGADAAEHPLAIRLRDAANVRDLPGYAEGWFSVQDLSAMRVASALAPKQGERVLDLCAAPGGKSTHLAEIMQDTGSVTACDIDAGRLATVRELALRLGLKSIQTHSFNPEHTNEIPGGPFDAVLADVPCSNTGVLGRRPEVRWRLKPEDVQQLVMVQARLLRIALDLVRPGGVVVYSTCSIEPDENGGLVRRVLRERKEVRLESEQETVPGQPSDGSYWARLKKG
ncbi:MAG: 16S rRNA (cytosine(967)-C(5))-methyltransferase RsmB [Planctomycetia bacterium]|nr:16S rRNA (cytosine(967)-C(5))-methyltransferase RsmB [Planctomycetia bacterium]